MQHHTSFQPLLVIIASMAASWMWSASSTSGAEDEGWRKHTVYSGAHCSAADFTDADLPANSAQPQGPFALIAGQLSQNVVWYENPHRTNR